MRCVVAAACRAAPRLRVFATTAAAAAPSATSPELKRVAVIGGGIAGASLLALIHPCVFCSRLL
jgi:hypothetical protein